MSGEVDSIELSPILFRVTELYMNLCTLVSALRVQINYGRKSELAPTLEKYRKTFYELYYLVRIHEKFDSELKNRIETWQSYSFKTDIPPSFYRYSLELFDDLSNELQEKGIIKM